MRSPYLLKSLYLDLSSLSLSLSLSLPLHETVFAGYDTARSVGKEKTGEKHLGEWSRCQKTDDLWPLPRVDYATRVSELLISQSPFLPLCITWLRSDFYRLIDELKHQMPSRVFFSPLESAHLNQAVPVSTNTQSVQPLQTSISNATTSLMNGDEKRPLNHIQTYRYALVSSNRCQEATAHDDIA